MNHWYWVTPGDNFNIHYLISGESKESVWERMKDLSEVVKVVPASWRSIQKVILCRTPIDDNTDDHAFGCIQLLSDTINCFLWCD